MLENFQRLLELTAGCKFKEQAIIFVQFGLRPYLESK